MSYPTALTISRQRRTSPFAVVCLLLPPSVTSYDSSSPGIPHTGLAHSCLRWLVCLPRVVPTSKAAIRHCPYQAVHSRVPLGSESTPPRPDVVSVWAMSDRQWGFLSRGRHREGGGYKFFSSILLIPLSPELFMINTSSLLYIVSLSWPPSCSPSVKH